LIALLYRSTRRLAICLAKRSSPIKDHQ
jgi:hypothetical protein